MSSTSARPVGPSAVPISYASGTAGAPLLGETIDANLRRAVARFGGREVVIRGGQNVYPREVEEFQAPRYVHAVDAFPMTVTGEVRKVQMREEAIEILGLGEVAATSRA